MKVRNSFYFVFCALSWGSSYLLIKLILNEIPPADIAMYRVLLGFLTTTAFIKSNKKIERKDHSLLALVGILWFTVPSFFYAVSLESLSSSIVGIVNGTTPLIIAALASLLFKEKINKYQVAYLMLGYLGIAILNIGILNNPESTTIGLLQAVIAALGYSLSVNIVKPLLSKYGSKITLKFSLLYGFLGNLIFYSPLLTFEIPKQPINILSLLFLGIVGTGLAYYFYYELIIDIGVIRSTIILYLIPVIAILFGVLLLNEAINGYEVLGLLVIIFSSFMFLLYERQK